MITIKDNEQFPLPALFLDTKGGSGAGYRNGVTWTAPACVRLDPDPAFESAPGVPDDLHRLIVGVAPGNGQIVVTTDGGVGSTADPVHGVLDVVVTAGLVASISLIPGPVTPQAV